MILPQAAAAQDPAETAGTGEPYRVSFHRSYTEAEWTAAEREAEANLSSCDEGDQSACVRLGEQYLGGRGVPRILDLAVLLFTEACDAAAGDGCAALGQTYLSPYQNGANPVEAARLFKLGCDLGSLSSCARYSEAIKFGYDLFGSEGRPDIALAKEVARVACGRGGDEACTLYAQYMLHADAPPGENATGFAMLDAQCRAGGEEACKLALYEVTRHPDPDPSDLLEYHDLACTAGDDYSCKEAGLLLYGASGENRDVDAALAYFDRACALRSYRCEGASAARTVASLSASCDTGNEDACLEVGLALANSGSPIYDPEAARGILAPACLAGRTEACGEAAILQPYTASSEQERAETISILELGCDTGHADACFRLVRSMEDGELLPSNPEREGRIYASLCEEGYNSACERAANYAGIVPGIAIEEADFLFSPPTAEDGTEPLPDELAALLKKKMKEQAPYCPERTVEFRGVIFTDDSCEIAPAAIGSYRLKPGQAPWQALLWRPATLKGQRLSASQRVLCGGALIATGWVLTAAHCLVDEGKSVKSAGHRIRLGVYNPQANEGMSYPILDAKRHPSFTTRNYAYDIALIHYDHRNGQRLGSVQTIRKISLDPLPLGQRTVARGIPVYSYGWGRTALNSSETTDYLQGVKMELRSETECRKVTKFNSSQLKDAVLCAIGANRQSTCNGDSGGPLVHYSSRPVLIGVVSGGKACGTTGVPSRYPRIAKVRSWIDRTIR